MWKIMTLAAMIMVSASLQAQPSAQPIGHFLNEALPASGSPGMAYAIIDKDVIRTGARGELVKGSGEPVTSNTPFLLGSITKSFTALGIMQLHEAGLIALDAPVSRYLPDFAEQEGAIATIRQLLSHTSGYSTLQGNLVHSDDASDMETLAHEVARDAQAELAFVPGSRFDYSNANYRILGRVIETVSGRDYAAFIEEEILAPLEMADSFVSDGETHPQMATGHSPWFLTKRALEPGRTHRVNAPAGGVIASARDMAKFLTMMMNGKDDLISAANKSVMMQPASAVSPGYGLGWFIAEGGATIYHTGTSPGVETQATMIPAEKRAAIVLVNAGSGMGFGETGPLTGGITARALGYEYQPVGGKIWRQTLLAGLALAPVLFVLCAIWAWRRRDDLRAKSGIAGRFSLYFPLAMMLVMGWILLWLVPRLFGTSLGSLYLFLPDMVLAMAATTATGLAWALLRIGLWHGSGRLRG